MTKTQIEELVRGEYQRRYKDWPGVNVPHVVSDIFNGTLAVVRTSKPHGIEELCFVDPQKGVRIFSTTEELADFIENKVKTPLLDERRRRANKLFAIIGLVIFSAVIFALWERVDGSMVTKNLAAIAGLPFAFIAAFAIVALFRQGEAPLDFEGLGLRMKGATGEIVLWLLCFVAISGSISLLWRA